MANEEMHTSFLGTRKCNTCPAPVDQNLEMALMEVSVSEVRIKAYDMLSLYTTARVKPVSRSKSSQIRTTAPLAHVAARWN